MKYIVFRFKRRITMRKEFKVEKIYETAERYSVPTIGIAYTERIDSSITRTKWPRLFFKIHLKTVQFPWLRTTTRAVRSNERGVRRWKDTTGTENLIKSLYEAE